MNHLIIDLIFHLISSSSPGSKKLPQVTIFSVNSEAASEICCLASAFSSHCLSYRGSHVVNGSCSTSFQGQAVTTLLRRSDVTLNTIKEMLASYDTDVAILLDLEVPEDELTKRILERGKTSGRTDDANIETIKNRIAEYNKKTKPVMDFYAAEGKKVVINGVGSVDEIFANLCKAIDAVK